MIDKLGKIGGYSDPRVLRGMIPYFGMSEVPSALGGTDDRLRDSGILFCQAGARGGDTVQPGSHYPFHFARTK